MKKRLDKYSFIWPLAGSILVWIFIALVSGIFSINQFLSCAKLASFALLLGLAQMVVVTSGEGAIDLSQQYILTLCAYLSCNYMNLNPFLGFAIAILVGGACGLLNGCINIYLKVPAMITTLASGYIFFTIILKIAPYMSSLPNKTLVKMIHTNFMGVSVLTIICIFVAVMLYILMYKTKFGKQLHAVGQKRTAADYAGVPVKEVVMKAFMTGGLLCGLAGVLCGAFIGGAFQDMGSTYFLPSIAATFVGGTAAGGGKSSVTGVCFGALMMSFMTTFLNTANLSPGSQKLILGAFLVLIIVISVSGDKKDK